MNHDHTTTNTATNHTAEAQRERLDIPSAILWASAFVLTAAIVLSSGFLGGQPAYAQVDRNGDVITTTAATGSNEDVLLVLDQRNERLFVYGMDSSNRMRLYDGIELPELFTTASRSRRGNR